MRSLSLKFIGAFALVVLVGAAITYLVARRAVANQFELYVSRRGQLRAASWAPQFADYYAQHDGWSDVETLLTQLPISMPRMVGPMGGPTQGPAMGHGRASIDHPIGMVLDARILLADVNRRVVLDSEGQLTGQTLNADVLSLGSPVTIGEDQIGTLVVADAESGPSAELGGEFLDALNRGVLLAAVVAGLVALALGALLVRQLIAPLRDLQSAAASIAGGDLSQRVTVTSRDELGQVGDAFNQMAQELERNEQLRRNMMTDIAHELRNPLTIIQGQIEALLDGVFPLTPEQLAPIHEETILLSRLVSDLRDLALAEAGKLALQTIPLDVGDVIRSVVAAAEPVADERSIVLSADVPSDLPIVSADPHRLRQVLHNLLANALRHTPGGGRIAISAEFDSSSLCVIVSDNGPGIPSQDLPHIFGRFYRGHESHGAGSGLGLAISRYIVEAHGGHIWAQNRAEGGTQIAFTLPSLRIND